MEHPINSNNPFADNEMPLHTLPTHACMASYTHTTTTTTYKDFAPPVSSVPISISGLVVEYIVAIDVTRVRFPADAICPTLHLCTRTLGKNKTSIEEPTTPSHNIVLYQNSPRPGIEPWSSA